SYRDLRVAGGRRAQVAVARLGVVVEAREALAERHPRDARKHRQIAVEADHLSGREAMPRGDLGGGRGPLVRLEAGGNRARERSHANLASTDAACSGRPSSSAKARTIPRTPARPSRVARTTCTGFRNASSPSPPAARASPPVGSTCVAPAA